MFMYMHLVYILFMLFSFPDEISPPHSKLFIGRVFSVQAITSERSLRKKMKLLRKIHSANTSGWLNYVADAPEVIYLFSM